MANAPAPPAGSVTQPNIFWVLRWNIFLSLFISFFVNFPEQSLESIQALSENIRGNIWESTRWIIKLYFPLVMSVHMAWLWSKFLLYKFDCDRRRWPFRHLPRIVAIAPIFFLGVSFFRVEAYINSAVCLLLTAAAYLIFRVRRTRLRDKEDVWYGCLIKAFKNWTFWLVAMMVFSIITEGGFKSGPIVLLLIWSLVWVPLGSLLVLWSYRRFPPFICLFLLAAVWSAWDCNDNHTFRTLEKETKEKENNNPAVSLAARKQDLSKTFNEWLSVHQRNYGRKGEPYPVFLVAAEGGGIRAAYFTGMLLAKIQDENSSFAHHLFAISGISGGSVGSTVFAALMKKYPAGKVEGKDSYSTNTKDILGQDFLSPLLARGLFPDLLQRFVPWPIASFDRTLGLENTLEDAWGEKFKEKIQENTFARGFGELKGGDAQGSVPALFLNTTRVETGERIVFSSLRPSTGTVTFTPDLDQFKGKYEVPLSTAAFLSSRFTYVTPAGTAPERDDKKRKIRLVDGGYYENSGMATLLDIFHDLYYNSQSQPVKCRFYAIVIRFEDAPKRGKRQGFSETMSPILALLKTRDARGSHSLEMLEKEFKMLESLSAQPNQTLPMNFDRRLRKMKPSPMWGRHEVGNMISFVLKEEKVTLPLGWSLSKKGMKEIEDQVGVKPDEQAKIGSIARGRAELDKALKGVK